MGFAQSIVGLQWAYPIKRQVAYATQNPDVDITQSHPFEGADIVEHAPNMTDNSAQLGRGHEFATRADLLSWNSMFKRSFTATTKILGWASAFHCGSVTTTGLGGSPSAYQHVMVYQDPFGTGYYGSGRQQPVFTVLEKVTSGMTRRFPSMSVKAIELTAQLGDWLRLAVECQGSGMKSVVTGFSFPDQSVSEGERLRFASMTFSHGVSGAEADISCDVRSIRFRSEYSYFENDGYCPGSGYLTTADANSGQIRNKLEFGRRACLVEFVVRADNTTTLLDRLEARTEVTATMTFVGATISGANAHKLIVRIPRVRYKAVPIAADGDLITYQVQGLLLYDATLANPYQITVVSDQTGLLVSS
jgi:hypothetical protein